MNLRTLAAGTAVAALAFAGVACGDADVTDPGGDVPAEDPLQPGEEGTAPLPGEET